MHRARQHAETRTRERRRRLAHEAARLMAESGIRDFRQAKRKAALRLGILEDASLPRNREIEEALREYRRLFGDAATQADRLRQRRLAALRAMAFFARFHPRLVGAALDGGGDAHSPVSLHLHADDPQQVAALLLESGIPAESRMRRIRLDRDRSLDVDVWLFSADEESFDLSVLPMRALRQAPLSAVDEKPMARASNTQLRRLLAENECREYENALPPIPPPPRR
ncbi:hypothetical protein EBB59_05215 [Lysobacter pythonis]|uniref:Uncharacterized protein n=1 Tax=Solilutibacter pythonis TaxID=2483112 RepID=A0A3M2I0K2_9GAMM|nr:hypothetical protein [Lysobacter pythonis]RMH93430.1 hypothetical protein EBB59_05215 [Lysobacter pythonis]